MRVAPKQMTDPGPDLLRDLLERVEMLEEHHAIVMKLLRSIDGKLTAILPLLDPLADTDEQVFALLLEYLEPLGNFNARDVVDEALEEDKQPFRQAVLNALQTVNPRGGDTITPRRIGSLLGRVKGRAISGMCLKHLRDDHEGAVYYIMRTELAD
jgi:hypothetical protein